MFEMLSTHIHIEGWNGVGIKKAQRWKGFLTW